MDNKLFDFTKVLFVAPNYNKRKGGIASVMKQYEVFLDEKFIFRSSIYFQNIWISFLFFPCNMGLIFIKLITSPSIEIVHIHGSAEGSFYRKYIIYLLCKKILGKKIVYHIHASQFNLFYEKSSQFFKNRVQYLINNCDQIIVLSEEWLEFFNNTFCPKKINVLENIIPSVVINKIKKKDSKINMLFLGRIGDRKGIFDLINCFKENKTIFNDKVELFVGGDGKTKVLKDKIKEYKLSNVYFVGWVDKEKKRNLFLNTDILILPSYNEGLPISILEAMSYGLPIIATNVGGIPRVLKDRKNGVLIDAGNSIQIKEAIELYINNPNMISEHGKESLLLVKPYYPDNVFSKLQDIYNNM